MHENTIETWFDSYGQDVFNYLVYYTSSIDVEDLVQETFTKAWIKLRNYGEIENPKAWLFSIARNTATDAIRKKKRPIENTVRNNDLLNSLESHLSVEDKVQSNEEKRRLSAALFALKQSYREVLILRGIEDLSVSTTAQILGWSESKVKTTYFRAIREIQQHLQGGNYNGLVR
ncbi:RNA polymerase sigma factor [Alicyclobacillus ferrooxydans]|uniref:RNA polymerase subunit sigma-70 n=1 Tax=Alicyclobacillus ferrooxydans TaxID=471514 RepID=A0A0P9CJ21_9BACL|nr:RNA polymerase sigma factor [Alicyclobacillus ferrooxydans]KPV43008.1 hypothetical protein AN477_14595 [Alicyclobacillus ferrooxydans]